MSIDKTTTTTQGAEESATAATDPKTAIQADIEKIKTAIADLEAKGKDLFAEEIANLKTKQANAEAELEEIVTGVKTEIKTFEQQFLEKNGISIWVAIIGGGFVVWQVGAALLRVLGAL